MKKYLSIIPLIFLLCFVVGCQDKAAMAELEQFKAQATLEKENKTLVERYYDAWMKGDIEALREIISPDYVWHTTRDGDLSLEETIKGLKQQMMMFPDRTFSNEDLFVEGNKIVARYIFGGTHIGDAEGFPATGNKFKIAGFEITRVEDGKIVESWELADSLSLLLQLGYELKPPEEKK